MKTIHGKGMSVWRFVLMISVLHDSVYLDCAVASSEFGVRVSAKLILEFDTNTVTLHVMPIYEFHCEKCERDSEILVRSSDWKGTKCPSCGSTKLKKKLSVFASGGADAASAGPACSTNGGGGSCGCHCAGGKHRH